MNIALFIYNRLQMYSGGQYHAFALGKSIASLGHHVDFYWNHPPVFLSEFSAIDTRNFLIEGAELEAQTYDYVVVAPSGFFVPSYYEAALQLAAASKARICLLNYESANWFNNMAPTPDDPRVWDYWRRVLARGGVVVSSTRESDRYARLFYNSPISELFFEVSSPPINSEQANEVLAKKLSKDGSVVVFVRRAHDYKGGDDLFKLSPTSFSNRSLHVIFGGQQDDEFLASLKAHLGGHDVTVIAHSCISAIDKYILLAKAQALLFPSHFEGFGYPPIEAFSVGTEVVCYDLPVLRENLDNLAFFAPRGETHELEACLIRALSTTRDTSVLVTQADSVCGFSRAGLRFEKVLERHLSHVRPLNTYAPCLHWGPFNNDQAVSIPAGGLQVPYPPFVETSTPTVDGLIIDVRIATDQAIIGVEVEGSCVEYISIVEIGKDDHQEVTHHTLRLLRKQVGLGLLHFRLKDSTNYTEIIRIVL